ncbi:MAG: hypothetical protein N4J56_002164 [Chroococcidiopsis sp. SAG 2025]|nr:hypothetical protein [Chroococcidiopsis sp. SAG 2025]
MSIVSWIGVSSYSLIRVFTEKTVIILMKN